jgi:hypothetical protein
MGMMDPAPVSRPDGRHGMNTDDDTSYLLRNPAGTARLLAAMERARRGEFTPHELTEPTEPDATRE